MSVQGTIPAYAAGVLFRTGLGPRTIETDKQTTFKVNHWFDNLAQVHRFQIHAPNSQNGSVRVTHNSRSTCDGAIENIKKTGKISDISFGKKYDPCKSLFQKLQSVFYGAADQSPHERSSAVTLSPNFPGLSKTGQKASSGHPVDATTTLCNKTDATTMQMLDPETLEPIGIAKQQVLDPLLKGPMSAAHAEFDPTTGDVFNFNLDMGRQGSYRVFTVSAATGKTSILATIHHNPAYLHSLFLTEHYVVLCVWNSFFIAGGASMLLTKNIAEALKYDDSYPATWFVIDRTPGGKGLIATYESPAFFCFHTINAYEEASTTKPGEVDIIADLVAYKNIDLIERFYIDNVLSDSPSAMPFNDPKDITRGALRRYRLPAVPKAPTTNKMPAELVYDSPGRGSSPELPVMNGKYTMKPHRYVYGVTDTGKSTFFDGLVKHDCQTREDIFWSEHAQTAGEPIFVADPEGIEEDSGVLLTVVLDGIEGKSYLLCLNARDMTEIGRANVESVVGFGFHGVHVPASKL